MYFLNQTYLYLVMTSTSDHLIRLGDDLKLVTLVFISFSLSLQAYGQN